jgi:hypothetical protein
MKSYTNAIMEKYGNTESVTPSGAKCIRLKQQGENLFCVENTESELKWLNLLICGSIPALSFYSAFDLIIASAAFGISTYICHDYLGLSPEEKHIKILEEQKVIYIAYNQLNKSSENNYTSTSVMQQINEDFRYLNGFTTAAPVTALIAQEMFSYEDK